MENCNSGIADVVDKESVYVGEENEGLLPIEFYMNLRMRDDRGADAWSSAFINGEKCVDRRQSECTTRFMRMLSELEERNLELENEVCKMLDKEKRIEQENEMLRTLLHEAVDKL
ncbi:hypothetical protein OCOL_000824 [Ordospora colligata]